MNKIVIVCFLAVSLLFSGCASEDKESAALLRYKSYYSAISESTDIATSSDKYSFSAEMTEESGGNRAYYIFLDDPQVAMYDVVMMAVENNMPYDSAVKMMPSIGVFDGSYSMIPYQVNKADGFVKGMVMSGSTNQESVNLKVMVEWKDKYREKVHRDFYAFTLDEKGVRER